MNDRVITVINDKGNQSSYTASQLAKMWDDGLLKAETLYWEDGMPDWRPLSDLFKPKSPPPVPSASAPEINKAKPSRNINPNRKSPKPLKWIKEPHMITFALILFLIFNGIGDLVGIWSANEDAILFEEIVLGNQYSDEDIQASDNRNSVIGLIRIFIFWITAVIFMRWTYLAVLNSRGFGASAMKYTPKWSAFYYIIPIICLYKPYKVMMEVWKVSMNPSDWQKQGGTLLISFWWYSWLLYGLLGNVDLKVYMKSESAAALRDSAYISMFTSAIGILSALFAILVINTIYHNQKRLVA
jgi:hypothetical protein